MRSNHFMILTLFLTILSSCGSDPVKPMGSGGSDKIEEMMSDYKEEVQFIKDKCAPVKQLHNKFNNVTSFISYFTSEDRLWNTKVLLNKRCILHLQFKYKIDGDMVSVVKNGTVCVINCIYKVSKQNDRVVSVKVDDSYSMDWDEFYKFFESDFDLSLIPLEIEGDEIPGLEDHFNKRKGQK